MTINLDYLPQFKQNVVPPPPQFYLKSNAGLIKDKYFVTHTINQQN